MDKWVALLKSRRFWVAVGGVAAVLLSDTIGISEEDTTKLVAIIIGWFFTQTLRPTHGVMKP